MEKKYHVFWEILPVIGLVLWGVFGITENLWYDEAYSAALVSHTPWEIILITARDVHSPFYYFFLKIFWELFGPIMGFRCLKWFSILAMMGYMLLGKYYVKKWFGEKVSVYFMFFSITMPIMLVQSSTVRMYTLALFSMTLMSLLMLELYREASRGKWLLFILASTCSVYSHTYAMLQTVFLYLIFLGAILYQKKYKLLKGFIISSICVAIFFLPWLLVICLQLQHRTGGSMVGAGAMSLVLATLKDCCKEWFSALEKPIWLVQQIEMAVFLFLGWNAVRWMRSRHSVVPALGILAIGLTIVASSLVYIFTGQGFFGRVFFPGFASLMLVYAVGMEQLRSKIVKILVILTVVVCFFFQYKSELELEYDPGLGTWKSFMEENVKTEDVVMAPNVHSLYLNIFCPEKNYMIYFYMPGNSPFRAEIFTSWEQLDQYEGTLWYVCGIGEEPEVLAERYTWEETVSFLYMYQDLAVFRLEPISM